VAGEPGGVGQHRGEPLHPSVDGDLIDLDAAFDQQFFHISVGEVEPAVPADRKDDHLGWETEPGATPPRCPLLAEVSRLRRYPQGYDSMGPQPCSIRVGHTLPNDARIQ
jgi:hypothetical protein